MQAVGQEQEPPVASYEADVAKRKGTTNAILLLVVPVLLFIFVRPFFTHTDPDYWWHVRTGQYIYETGTIPRVDIYSYTAAGRPWVAHEWLTELLFYVIQRYFGYAANVALFALIGAITWLAVYAACRLRGVGEPGAVVLLLWGFAMSMGSANVRPQGLTALLFAVYAYLLTRYRLGHKRSLWLLPPLMALWVNLHGGYVIGLALLALTTSGEILTRALRRQSAPLRPLLLATVLTLAATLVNPHGVEALLYPFSYAGTANASMRYIVEWQSPDFHKPLFLIFASSLLLTAILGMARRPLGTTDVLWSVTLALMALQSARHIPLFAIAAMPLLGARLQAEMPVFRRELARWRHPRLFLVVWPLLLVAIVAMLFSGALPEPQVSREPNPARFPEGAVEYLRETNVQGKLFNEYGWGGYLIYELYPDRLVFVDGRADVYGDEFIEEYMQVWHLKPSWRQVLDDYEVRLVLVDKDCPLAVVLGGDAAWRETYMGEVERLFMREAK